MSSRRNGIILITMAAIVIFLLNYMKSYKCNSVELCHGYFHSSVPVVRNQLAAAAAAKTYSQDQVSGSTVSYSSEVTVDAAPRIASVHLQEFKYIHWPKSCSGQPLLITSIVSAPSEFKQRSLRRRLFASVRSYRGFDLRWIFVLGSVHSADLQRRIDAEAASRSDILQMSFDDSYDNLTYKSLAGIDWTISACSSAQFFMKVDIDCMVNPYNIVNFLMQLKLEEAYKLYTGFEAIGKIPLRNTGNKKWRVSKQQYPLDAFPPYAAGHGYLISHSALIQLLQSCDTIFPFKLEDAYVGLCAKKAGVMLSNRRSLFPDQLRNYSDWCEYGWRLVVHHVQESQLPVMWQSATTQSLNLNRKCSKRK